MNSTTITLASYLGNIQIQIIRSLLTPTYIIGNLNNLANILIFSQNSLRSHICSWYFIGASIGHLFYLNMGCSTRVISAWTQYDLSLISLPFCKTRIYFVLDGLIISRYLFCLISIDRWMITSRNIVIRQQSSPKLAVRLIIGGVLFLLILNIFVSIGYVINKSVSCGPSIESCSYSFHIRHTRHHQIFPINQMTSIHVIPHRRQRYRKKDIQFIKLSLIQVAGYILFNTLHGYNTIYGVITQNNIKTANQQAIDGFMYGMGLNLHYIYTGITFFLYTLASVTFRKACILFWQRWSKRLLRLIFPQPTRQATVQHN